MTSGIIDSTTSARSKRDLDEGDVVLGLELLGEVEAGLAGADDDDTHGGLLLHAQELAQLRG